MVKSPFDLALDAALRAEGGYVNDAADRGGETRFGITAAVARQHGYTGAMAALPESEARGIYRREYWDALRLDNVAAWHAPLAGALFDVAVNMGVGTAARFLQRSLNLLNRAGRLFPDLPVDGVLGVRTLAALQHLEPGDAPTLTRLIAAYQARRYIEIIEADPTQERFTRGWMARLRMG